MHYDEALCSPSTKVSDDDVATSSALNYFAFVLTLRQEEQK